MRGLSESQAAPIICLTIQELRDRIGQNLLENYGPQEVAVDRELYLILDLLEEDDDLFRMVSDLYSKQVVGFYDTDTREIFIRSDIDLLGPNEKTTFAREATHLFQDQNFDLVSFLPEDEKNADRVRARLALVEGDATLTIVRYAFQCLSASERAGLGSTGGNDIAFRNAVRILREDLIVPYCSGMDFVIQLFLDGGWEAVDAAYKNPPESTAQIIDPERCESGDHPKTISMPELTRSLGEHWALLDSGVLGEFLLKVYLRNFLSPNRAAQAADGCGGARYLLLKEAP